MELLLRSIVIAGACFAGCSLVIDTDELVEDETGNGGASSGSGGKGGGLGGKFGGSGGTDSGSDVSVGGAGTGGTTTDAADVIVVDGAEGSQQFCASLQPTPTLCSDFDLQNLPAGWDTLDQWGNCQGVLDSLASVSAPRSFFASAPALPDGEQCRSALMKLFPVPTTELVIEFDLLVEAIDDSEWIYIATIDMSGGDGDDQVILRLRTSAAEVVEDVTLQDGGKLYSSHPVPEVPALGVWTHIRWSLSFTGSSAFSNIDINGKSTGEAVYSKDFLSAPTVRLGLVGAVGVSGPWALRFDNVVVDVN